MKIEKRFLSVREVAEILESPVRTVRRWCANGSIPTVETPSGRRVVPVETLRDRADIVGYCASREEEFGVY